MKKITNISDFKLTAETDELRRKMNDFSLNKDSQQIDGWKLGFLLEESEGIISDSQIPASTRAFAAIVYEISKDILEQIHELKGETRQ